MQNNGLNRYDIGTVIVGLVTIGLGVLNVILSTKANNIRFDEQANAWKKLTEKAQQQGEKNGMLQ